LPLELLLNFGNRYMHQIVCRLGLCPRPHWGSLHRSLDPIAGLGVGPTGNGKEGGEGKGREGGGRPGMPKSRVGKPTAEPTRMAGCCNLRYLTMWFPWFPRKYVTYSIPKLTKILLLESMAELRLLRQAKYRYDANYMSKRGKIGQKNGNFSFP